MILEVTVGAVITALFALIAFFLNRLINQNDRFQDETRRTHKVFGREITRNQSSLEEIKQKIEARAIDEETKRKIKTVATSLVEVQKELSVIKPTLMMAEENYGQIIVISDQLKAQEQKLKGLYEVMIKLTGSKTGR